MKTLMPIDVTECESVTLPPKRMLWGYSIVSACTLTIIGIVMLIAALSTMTGVILKGVEVVLSVGMVFASILLWLVILNKRHVSPGIGLLSGEIALASAFLYLGVTMPVFHQGLASSAPARVQFIAVLAGLICGNGALVLSGVSKPARSLGRVMFPAMVRDGVTLITGTILLAIAIGQLPGAALKPPQWNWISFLGITIPGMILLVAREAIKERSEIWQGLARFSRLLVTETMLILGLAIMLYGSYSNLTLGVNGYSLAVKGNATGFILWIAAVLLLLVIRGAF